MGAAVEATTKGGTATGLPTQPAAHRPEKCQGALPEKGKIPPDPAQERPGISRPQPPALV